MAARLEPCLELGEGVSGHGRCQFGHPQVHAHDEGIELAGPVTLGREPADAVGKRAIVGDDEPALGDPERLRRPDAEDLDVAARADRPIGPASAQRVRAVEQEREPVAVGHCAEPGEVRWVPGEMDAEDGPRLRPDGGLGGGRIERSPVIDVGHDRRHPGPDDGLPGREIGEAGHDHLRPRVADRPERRDEPVRAVGNGGHRPIADPWRQPGLDALDVWPEAQVARTPG